MMKSYAKLALGILAFVALNGNVSTESQSRLNLGEVTATAIDSVVFIPKMIVKFVVKIVGFIIDIFVDVDTESVCDEIENFSLGTTVVEFIEDLFSSEPPHPDVPLVEELIDLIAILKPDGLEASVFKHDGDFKSFLNHLFNNFPYDEAQQAFLNQDESSFSAEMLTSDGIVSIVDGLKAIDFDGFLARMENDQIQRLFTLLSTIDFKGVAEGKGTTYDVTTFADTYLVAVDLEKSALFYATDGPLVDFFKLIIDNSATILALENNDGSIDYSSAYTFFKDDPILNEILASFGSMQGVIDNEVYFGYLLNSGYENIMVEVFGSDFETFVDKVV